ncbi:MAG TPA: hypothetical protein VEB86_18175, partial [Chryseosolibacter sp.]|nr:hypothetical protein [Chryseosolibacter sp.]
THGHFGFPLLAAVILITCAISADAQSIVGKWQLVDETSCLEGQLADADNSLAGEMAQMSSATPQLIEFREKGSGEESTRILNKRRSANSKNFLYKFTGETLYILDKKSQTISESFTVDKLTTDSLVISNAGRACEIKFFVKIKSPK